VYDQVQRELHRVMRRDGELELPGAVPGEQLPDVQVVCNGQYVNTSDVEQCIAALNGVLTAQISVTASATGSSECEGSTCSGQESAKAKLSCAVAPGGTSNGPFWAFSAGALGMIASGRRRARR
jgi:MYXO-CTERM domain-containing protein